MAISQSRINANRKYNEKAYDRLAISVYKGQREQITAHAKEKGLSLNAYINGLIAQDMGEKLTRPNREEEQQEQESE